MKKRTKVILIFVLLILIAIGSAFIYANVELDRLLGEIEEGEVIEQGNADISEEVIETVKERHVVNVALFGCDNDDGDPLSGNTARSDAIKVVSLDYDNKKIKLSNLERDVVVYGPGEYQNYLHFNWAYWYGGPTLAVQTINYNLDLDITQYVTISFEALEKIVDAVGGVDIELTAREAYAFNGGGYTNSVMNITAVEGVNHLDGYNAMRYARQRYIDSDFVRVERQNNVIKAVLKKVKSMGISDIYSLINDMLPYVKTNIPANDIKKYVMDLIGFDLFDIKTNTEPNGEYNDICTCPGLGGYLVRSYSDMAVHLHGFIYGDDFKYSPSQTVLDNEKNIYNRFGEFSKQ